ncbi:MAG: hypothetical protein WD825_12770 [Gemmatimonadaceae bacterium]
MIMTPGVRKFALVAHVTTSVGWLGAVSAFLVLSVAGLTSEYAQTVRSAYVAMNLIGLWAIVPLSLAALLTGLLQALGTHWGLFRHYWVLAKFALTIVATTLLLLHQFTAVAEAAGRVAVAPAGILPDVGGLGTQLVFDAGAAVLVLLVTTTLSIYKPWGRTRYGQHEDEPLTSAAPTIAKTREILPAGLRIFLAIIGVIVATIVIVHLAGGGMGRH